MGTVYVDDVQVGARPEVGVYQKEDAAGNTLWSRKIYDGLGRLIQEQTEKDGNQAIVVHRTYDALGQLARQTVPVAVTSAPAGIGYVLPSGNEAGTSYQYDALGRTTVVTNPDNTTVQHFYFPWRESVYDGNGHAKVYQRDAFDRLVKVEEYEPGLTLYATTLYGYDIRDNLTQVTDGAGNVTTMGYNLLGRKTSMADPDMGPWDYDYDPAGNLTVQDDARHQRICFYYDELSRLKGKYYTTDTTNCPASPTYNVSYGYDTAAYGKGRRTSMSVPNADTTSWTYDARGRVTQESKVIVGGGDFVTQWQYDPMDRVVWTKYPGGDGQVGETVYTTYNAQGLANSVYGTSSYVQSAAFNALGQPTEMTLGNGALTRWGYWGLGGAWDSRPGDGFTSLGRLFRLRTRDSAGRPLLDLRYGYDAVGNVTSIKEAPREAANWPTSGFTFQDDFNTKDTTNWTWSSYQTVPYNDGGNNVVKSSGTGVDWNAHFYRNAYSLTSGKGLQVRFKVDRSDTVAQLGVEANDATYRRFGVIADGGRLSVQYNDGSGWRYPADLLTNLALNTWYVVRIVVDDGGRGFYVEAYQENSPTVRGAFSQWMPTGKSWRFHHWIWRGNAYIDTYREFNAGGLTWSPDERMTFTYDALDRLTNSAPESGGQGYSEGYAYNNIGNMTSKGGVSYGYNDPAHKHGVTHLGGVQKYWYDANGNMTTRIVGNDIYDLTWDTENRLTQVKKNSSVVATFVYDGDGNRVKATVNGTTTAYVGNYFEWSGSTSTMVTYYYLGGQRVAMRKAGVVQYVLGDHLRSTTLVLDQNGAKVDEMRYYPYGAERWPLDGTFPTDYRFTGQWLESSINLYLMGARWYDAALGRWISPDTLVPGAAGGSGGALTTLGYDDQVRLTPLTVGFHETQFLSVVGEENRETADKGFPLQQGEREQTPSKYRWGPLNPQALNRYAYCLGNPLRYVDPTGHYQWTVVWQDNWGPLSRKEADLWTNGSSNMLSFILWSSGLAAPPILGIPGFVVSLCDVLAIMAIDERPFHEGDYGSDTIYYDPDQGQYWRLVYYFDEDGNLLSYQCYFSWDGTNWVLVTNITDYYPSDKENGNQ